MRRPFVGGNWKMNTTRAEAPALARAVAAGCGDVVDGADVVVFPPFVWLDAVGEALRTLPSAPVLGAQDISSEPRGAFTGEVSAAMLRETGVSVVLAGHSERRHIIGEDDDLIIRKVRAILAAQLDCVLCIGEQRAQRERGETDDVNRRQLQAGLRGVDSETALARVIVAYEPVWAIGTGLTASPEDAQSAHAAIRAELAEVFDDEVAARLRIIYGGSVKPENARDLFAQDDVDGFLVGGASLDADDFIQIVRATVP